MDASVSSAFVFVLVEAINTDRLLGSGLQGIKGAMNILDYLSKNGNKAAEKRITDVKEMCQHLDIVHDIHIPSTATPNASDEANEHQVGGTVSTYTLDCTYQNVRDDIGSKYMSSKTASTLQSDWRQSFALRGDCNPTLDDIHPGINGGFETSLLHDNNDLEFSFNFDQDFVLTGADETDWEEFERQIARLQ